jgi:hypothetical protein
MPLTALLRLPSPVQSLTRQPRLETMVSSYRIPPRSPSTSLLPLQA